MSITVNLYYTGKNGSARAFAEEMVSSGTVALVRAEEGNERYEYFFPMEDPETVLLIDRWRDQAALDEHHHSEMMPKIAAAMHMTPPIMDGPRPGLMLFMGYFSSRNELYSPASADTSTNALSEPCTTGSLPSHASIFWYSTSWSVMDSASLRLASACASA
mgnify:CR=1 FL=1